MDWLTLVSYVVGTLGGAAPVMVTLHQYYRYQLKREQARWLRDARRALYVNVSRHLTARLVIVNDTEFGSGPARRGPDHRERELLRAEMAVLGSDSMAERWEKALAAVSSVERDGDDAEPVTQEEMVAALGTVTDFQEAARRELTARA